MNLRNKAIEGEPETRNKAALGAWRKGYRAFFEGCKLTDNPYGAYPNGEWSGWARACQRYWRRGWETAANA